MTHGSLFFSRFLSQVTHGQQTRIFHRLHPEPVELLTELWQQFSISEPIFGDLVAKLRRLGLVVRGQEEDIVSLHRAQAEWDESRSYPFILYILTSRDCNMRCSYCPVPTYAADLGSAFLRQDEAVKILELWLELLESKANTDSPHYIIFYGGEPLINPEPINPILDVLRRKRQSNAFLPEKLSLVLATNGTLLNPEILRVCSRENIVVQLGLDGLSNEENCTRVDTSFEPTLDHVISAARAARTFGVELAASVSVTPKNLHFVSTATERLANLGIGSFGFNMLKGNTLDRYLPLDEQDEFFQSAAAAILTNFETNNRCSSETFAWRKWQALRARQYFPIECSCYGNQLVLHADGKLGNCPFNPYVAMELRGLCSLYSAIGKQRFNLIPDNLEDISAIPHWIVTYGGGCRWDAAQGEILSWGDNRMNRAVTETLFNHMIWLVDEAT